MFDRANSSKQAKCQCGKNKGYNVPLLFHMKTKEGHDTIIDSQNYIINGTNIDKCFPCTESAYKHKNW